MHGLIKFFDALALIPMFVLGFVLVAAMGDKPEVAEVAEPPVVEAEKPPELLAISEASGTLITTPTPPPTPAAEALTENPALMLEPTAEIGQRMMEQPNQKDFNERLQRN